MTARTANPFSPRAVLGMLLFGALTFLLTLYFIGTDNTGTNTNNGGGHAAGKGLNGFAALVRLMETTGHTVTINRNEGALAQAGCSSSARRTRPSPKTSPKSSTRAAMPGRRSSSCPNGTRSRCPSSRKARKRVGSNWGEPAPRPGPALPTN